MLGQVEPYQQAMSYSCSAAVLHAILKHWGFDISEAALAQLIRVDPIRGANAKRVMRVARDLGYKAESRTFSSLNEMKRITDQDAPVIVRVLSWKHPGQYHFAIVTSIDDFGVSVMDPNVEGNRRRLTHEEMWRQFGPDRIGIVIAPKQVQLDGVVPSRAGLFWVSAAAILGLIGTLGWWATRTRN